MIQRYYQQKHEKYQKVLKKLYELQNLANQKYDYFIKVLSRYRKSLFFSLDERKQFCHISRNVQMVLLHNENFKQFIHIFFLMAAVKIIQVSYFVC